MLRFEYSELKRQYVDPEHPEDVWTVTSSLQTSSKALMAGALRALADELDPPKKDTVYRDR